MRTTIRKTNIDVIHVYQDESLWCVMRTFSKNKPRKYFVINEYNHLNEPFAPREVNKGELNSLFKYDLIGLFEDKDDNIIEDIETPPGPNTELRDYIKTLRL